MKTLTFRSAPVTLRPYDVINRSMAVPAPQVDGFVVAMHAELVDAAGRRMPVQRVMLHHVVFLNRGRFDGDERDTTYCKGGRSQRFYGTGEEDQAMLLPTGYGYRIRARDRWRVGSMLMSHTNTLQQAFVEYTVTVDTNPRLTPVTPYWIGAVRCTGDPIFNVQGTGRKGAVYEQTRRFAFPRSGRIVAAGSHLHGGALALVLSQPRCRWRSLVESRSRYGMPDHPYYHVLPVLHEPGPIATSWMTSATGVPVQAGDDLRIRAVYDAERSHVRVMGIMHVYVAPPLPAAAAARTAPLGPRRAPVPCPALPRDVRAHVPDVPARLAPPAGRVPLTALGPDGVAREVTAPPGRVERFGGVAKVVVRRQRFSRRNLSVARGATVRWASGDRDHHDITLADGPAAFASRPFTGGGGYVRRLTVPGTYKVYCSLHPVAMTQRIVVRAGR